LEEVATEADVTEEGDEGDVTEDILAKEDFQEVATVAKEVEAG
jgi:hypothetical protein